MKVDLWSRLLAEHGQLSRRWLLQAGAWGAAALAPPTRIKGTDERHPTLATALSELESFITRQEDFQDVSRGNPKPHSLPDETRQRVGLTRETWKLEVRSDDESPARLRNPLTVEQGTELDFAGLLDLARNHSVRFPKVMTCLNLGCPLGMGIWEGVPLRELIWKTEPSRDLRRVFYHGFHNDDPAQMFRSSLPVGRVLEDPFDLPPVILCYKLNDQWLTPERGGPVRIVVPEAYGFKSIKWLSHVFLSNIPHANDTYAEQNNDVDSPMKSFAATLTVPDRVKADEAFAVTGYAQVGISGVSKVQVWIQNRNAPWPREDRYFREAPWQDAELMGPPENWGGEFADRELPHPIHGFDEATKSPSEWPMRLGKVHWGFTCAGLPAGEYTLRSRTVDDHGIGQPLPRPFRKSGHAAIESVDINVGD